MAGMLAVVLLGTLAFNHQITAPKPQPEESKVEEASYIVYKEDSTYYAKNGNTGAIDYSRSKASQVIQNASDALTNGGKIFLREASYTIDAQLSLSTKVILEGEGMSTELISNTGNTSALSLNKYSELRNIHLKLDSTNDRGVKIEDTSCAIIDNIHIEGASGSVGYIGIEVHGRSYYNKIIDARLEWLNCGILLSGTGIGEDDRPGGTLIENPYCWEVGVGIQEEVGVETTIISPRMGHSVNGRGIDVGGDYTSIIGGFIQLGEGSTCIRILPNCVGVTIIGTSLNSINLIDRTNNTGANILYLDPYRTEMVLAWNTEIKLMTESKGLLLTAPNGTVYRIKVENDGTIVTEEAE